MIMLPALPSRSWLPVAWRAAEPGRPKEGMDKKQLAGIVLVVTLTALAMALLMGTVAVKGQLP